MHFEEVDSTAIEAIAYEQETRTLTLKFRSQRTYSYADVPPELHAWLMKSPGKGGLFNRLVRDKFVETELFEEKGNQDLSALLRASLDDPE